MDRYNPDGKCIKCGSGEIYNEHREVFIPSEQVKAIAVFIDRKAENIPERIVRTCKHCGFTWDEATLDSVEATSFKASDMGQLEIGVGDWVSIYGTGKYELIHRCSAQVCLFDGMGYKLVGITEIQLIRKGPSKPIEIDMGQVEVSGNGRYWQGPLPPKGTPDGSYDVYLRPIREDSQ